MAAGRDHAHVRYGPAGREVRRAPARERLRRGTGRAQAGLVAGPNGAGKSTFVGLTLAPLLKRSVFVNADEIALTRWPDDPSAHAYDAAIVAAQTPEKLIELGQPFIAETVFSPTRPNSN